MNAAIITGKGSAFFIGTFEVTADEVSIEPEVEDIKDKSTTALGRVRHAGGFSTTRITMKGYFDPTNNPVAVGARDLRAGVKVAGLKWEFVRSSLVLRYLAAYAVVESFKVTDVAEKRAEVEGAFVVDGLLLYPGD